MICPVCGAEMEDGYLQSEGVTWVKKPHKISLLPKQGEVMLEYNIIKMSVIPASICKSCKRVLADYSGKNSID